MSRSGKKKKKKHICICINPGHIYIYILTRDYLQIELTQWGGCLAQCLKVKRFTLPGAGPTLTFNFSSSKALDNICCIDVHSHWIIVFLVIYPGARHGVRQKINGLQQRKDFHPRCKWEHSKCLQGAVPEWFGQVSHIKITGDEEWRVHVPGLLGKELCGPHRPRWGRPPLRDPLSGCLGWSCPRGNHTESFPVFIWVCYN